MPENWSDSGSEGLWAKLVHRLFPWRTTKQAAGPIGDRLEPNTVVTPRPGTRIVRAESFNSTARFTGRTIDRMMLSAAVRSNRLPSDRQLSRVADEIQAAHTLYRQDQLALPDSFHAPPPQLNAPSIQPAWHPSLRFEWMSFESGYEPHKDDPSRSRWSGYERNRTAHAWVVRHRDPNRPWVICMHGLGMGGPYVEFSAFRARTLHHDLGLNLMFPVLPLHGPRKEPEMAPGSLLSFELLDAFHGVSQAIWDTRRMIQWARTQGAGKIGLYGISMGAYVSALLSGLENVDSVIAGIPLCDIPNLFLHHAPEAQRRQVNATDRLRPNLHELFELVSPLELEPLVPQEHRFIFAASDDQISTSHQARRLWDHWQQPGIHWFPGGHVSFFLSKGVRMAVNNRLHSSGFGVLDP